jgi:predicted phosphodiesterase
MQYHFVGSNLILEDAEARLIVDYIPDAVREPVAAEAKAPPPTTAPRGPAQPVQPLPAGPGLLLPQVKGSVRFAVMGDTGSASNEQYELGRLLTRARADFPFEFVLLLGDNIYGTHTPQDFVNKFEKPYEALLKGGVKFYAALGNHDDQGETNYRHFNMGGKRFYTFKPAQGVRIFALDTNYLDKEQLAWLERELQASGSDWKICFFHHPLYSSGGKHGGLESARQVLEPLFTRHGVDVVFAGHEHFYERLKPQRGIHHFTSGAAGKLRRGDIRKGSPLTAKGFDTDFSFMLVEIVGGEMYFQVLSRSGRTVDGGIVRRTDPAAQAAQAVPAKP